MEPEGLTREAEEIKAMITPSAETIAATYDALKGSLEETYAGGETILEPLQAIREVFDAPEGSTSLSGGAGGLLGPIDLPCVGKNFRRSGISM